MMKIGKLYQWLAALAAAASVLSVVLAIASRFAGSTIIITQDSYMNFAIWSIIFAVFFLVQGMVSSKKD